MDLVLGSVIVIFVAAMTMLVVSELLEQRQRRQRAAVPDAHAWPTATAGADSQWVVEPDCETLDYINR